MIDKNSEEFFYFMQLVFGVDDNDASSIDNAFFNLDDLGVPYTIQNDVFNWAETYGAGMFDVSRVERDLERLLSSYGSNIYNRR